MSRRDNVAPPTRNADHPRVSSIIFALFVVSGAAGLIYQVLWTRYLTTILSSTTQAISAVLAAFMGGLALGSYLAGRSRIRQTSAIRLYAVLEIGIGLYALLFPFLLQGMDALYMAIYPAIESRTGLTLLVRLGIALALLIVPTSLMGATLPVIVAGVIGEPNRASRPLALLYGVNTIGAVIGTLGSAFILIPQFGLSVSLYVAVGLNLAVGLMAWLLAPRLGYATPTDEPSPQPPAAGANPFARQSWFWLAIALGVSGFAAIGLEVAWTRALVIFAGNSTHAFATIVATFLAGIGLGSLIQSRVRRFGQAPWRRLALLQMAIGLTSLIPALILSHAYYALAEHFSVFINVWATNLWIKFVEAALVFFLPTLLMGIALPLALALGSRDLGNATRATGSLYAVNTLGSIAGSLFVGFIAIPRMGSLPTSAMLAVLYSLSGIGLLWFARRRESARVGYAPWTIGLVSLILLWFPLTDAKPFSVLKDPLLESVQRRGAESIYYTEGVNTLAEVVEQESGMRSLFIDGIVQLDYGPDVQRLNRRLAELPLLMHPSPKRVLIIASGVGVTSGAALVFEEFVDEVVSVEIAAEVADATPLFAVVNHDLADSNRHRTIVDDGRHFLKTTRERFDVISTSAIHPKLNSGNASLYRREYFELIRSRLNPGGMVCHWVPLDMTNDEIRSSIRTFLDVFDYASLWFSQSTTPVGKYDVMLLGSTEPYNFDYATVLERTNSPSARATLGRTGILDPYDLLGNLILQGAALRQWAGAEGPIFTDDHPGLEFGYHGIDLDQSVLMMIDARKPPPDDWVRYSDEAVQAPAWNDRLAFIDALLAGDRKALTGDFDAAESAYRRAWELRPGHPDLRAAIQHLYASKEKLSESSR